MKENKYDDERFFGQYSQMSRSVQGLRGAGEWHELKKMLPDFNGKRVLDLGVDSFYRIYVLYYMMNKRIYIYIK